MCYPLENYCLVSPMILLGMKARAMILPSFLTVLICWLAQIPRQMYAVLPMVACWPSRHLLIRDAELNRL